MLSADKRAAQLPGSSQAFVFLYLNKKMGIFWRVHLGKGQTPFQRSRKESVSLMKSQIFIMYLKR